MCFTLSFPYIVAKAKTESNPQPFRVHALTVEIKVFGIKTLSARNIRAIKVTEWQYLETLPYQRKTVECLKDYLLNNYLLSVIYLCFGKGMLYL